MKCYMNHASWRAGNLTSCGSASPGVESPYWRGHGMIMTLPEAERGGDLKADGKAGEEGDRHP
jgi:hypothetical protein